MTTELNAAFTFTDFNGLSALRREAAQDSPDARRVVAQQFESMFISMMLSQMRKSTEIEGGLVDSERMRLHQDMYDQQLALNLAQGQGIGLADSILRQLGGPSRSEPATPTTFTMWRGESLARAGAAEKLAAARAQAAAEAAAGFAVQAHAEPSREEFVAAALPHARRAAAALGVPAEVIVAQAALETGWGRHTFRNESGGSAFNVFGIKATRSWSGGRVTVPTLEFVDGVPERRSESFRAYDSLAEGFDDYIKLVSEQPRYRDALDAGSAEEYARALQDGGYSTDPLYADKIMAIVEQGLPGSSAQAPAAAADSRVTGVAPAQGPAAGGDEI